METDIHFVDKENEMYDFESDPRIDPRLKLILPLLSAEPVALPTTREELVEAMNTASAIAERDAMFAALEMNDTEEVVPQAGLRVESFQVVSQPDGNVINIQFIRPDDGEVLACVYYIHGGAMATLSCYMGNYRAWAKIIAHQGVAVAMVDFRNALQPSSVPEVAPYPAGLNDCRSGLRWLHENAGDLHIDASRVVVAGESGGGNLTLALGMKLLREGDIGQVTGLYALAPYIAGYWPQPELPSSVENNGIWLDLHNDYGKLSYGEEALEQRDPLAWPLFAQPSDLKGLPRVVINVNECDPLRDEGIAFYRKLLASGVPARCRQQMGTIHATEVIPMLCPEVSYDTARDIAAFAKG